MVSMSSISNVMLTKLFKKDCTVGSAFQYSRNHVVDESNDVVSYDGYDGCKQDAFSGFCSQYDDLLNELVHFSGLDGFDNFFSAFYGRGL